MKKLIEKSDNLCNKIEEERRWKIYAEKFVQSIFDEYFANNNLTKSEDLLIRDLKWLFNTKLMNFGAIKIDDKD